MSTSFIDEVTLYAKAGDGGHGAVAWRREAHVPKGGPAGGDGGDGGDVVFICDENIHSLLDFKFEPRLVAKNGQSGRGKKQAGHTGGTVTAKVPRGTQIFDADSDELLADLTTPGEHFVACKGGSGGFGNARFATPSRQAPEFAKPGTAGEEKNLRLSLKLMADVGLLGFPNAGKSTFLSRISAARPKIANYPFTTLVPQLGVVQVGDRVENRSFVVADIPGVIEGAAEGAGLGLRFLKHLERVRLLAHLIEVPLEIVHGAGFDDADHHKTRGPVDLVERYEVLRAELEKFSDELASRPEVVLLNKLDLLDGPLDKNKQIARLRKHLDKKGVRLLTMSGVSGQGLKDVVESLYRAVQQQRDPVPEESTTFDPVGALVGR